MISTYCGQATQWLPLGADADTPPDDQQQPLFAAARDRRRSMDNRPVSGQGAALEQAGARLSQNQVRMPSASAAPPPPAGP
jgi:hypothetical protein